MAEKMNGDVTLIKTQKLWDIGNDFIGIDLIKINSQNNLRFRILLIDLTLSFSLKQIGASIRIFKFQTLINIGF